MEKRLKCFILVGGKSSRFQKDKSTLFFKYLYKLCKKEFKDVYLVAKHKKFKNYPFFIERSKEYAPIFPLLEILKKEKRAFILSVDTPNITIKSIKKLIKSKATSTENPLIGYYSFIHIPKLKKEIKNRKRVFFINKKKIKIPKKETININYQIDLKTINLHKYS